MLLCSSVASAAVTAGFTSNVSSGDAPLSVQFTDTSINATSWEWNFGDGSANSTVPNPVHTFTSASPYTVILTAYNGSESDSISHSITVTTPSPGVVVTAGFTSNVSSGDAPLSVQFTDTSTNATSWEWNFGDGSANSTVPNPVHTFTSASPYTVILTAYNGSESDTISHSITVTTPSSGVVVTAGFTSNVSSGDAPLSVQFTDTSTNATSWEWNFGDGSANSTVQNPVHTFTSASPYTVILTAYNGSESDTISHSITVTTPSSSTPVASFTTNVTDNDGEVPLIVQFNDTSSNSPTSWSWDFNGDGTEDSDVQNPVHTFDSEGTYNVTLKATNGAGTGTSGVTTITVHAENYYSGNRIWEEGMSTTYKWDAKSFSGFFYDLESGLSSENMTIKNIDRSLGDGDIVYKTTPVETDFEYGAWGSYQVIGFMAEKYFAAYTGDTKIDGVDEVSMMSSGQLSKILIDDDEEESVFAGSSLTLEDGYELNIAEVDVNGESVFVSLTKDGDELDSGVVRSNDDYIYKTDLGDADDVVVLAVHFDNVFSGRESNAVFINGIFQISDEYLELEDGDNQGKMEVTSISDDLIEMKNEDSVSLSKGDTIELMGSINLIVADDDDLRFAPYVDMSKPGTYELRGTVVEDDDLLTWTPMNFEGFYYDIDEGIRTETLKLKSIDGRKINDGQLEYTSTAASVDFEHSEWGKFDVIGFMAEKYFVGYTDDTNINGADDVSLLSDGQLSKVLMDDDEEVSVFSGSSLELEDGYSLEIVEVDVNGDRVLVELYKDGDEVDSGIASSNSDYVYEDDLGDSDDVPIVIIHFDNVFSGRESNAVFIQGIFQISDEYITLENGDSYDEMELDSFDSTTIKMSNEDSISLGSDDDIELMGKIGIKVADSSTLRYYPYVEVSTGSAGTLSIGLDSNTILLDDKVTISVTSSGALINGATIKQDGKTIGTTDKEGTLDYTFKTAGTYELTAEKDGYTTGSDDIDVIDEDDQTKKMTIEVSPAEIYPGTATTIYVTQAIGGATISGVNVALDGSSIGTTGSDGTVTYTATGIGTHKISATKDGLFDAETTFKVLELAADYEYSDMEVSPLEVKQGSEVTISVNITNSGTASGSQNVSLLINDNTVSSKTVTLDIGESTTIDFSYDGNEEVGTYKAQIGDASKTYEVVEKTSVVLYVIGAIALAAIGGVGYLFTAGGWTVEIAQAKAAEAVEAVKELVGNLR